MTPLFAIPLLLAAASSHGSKPPAAKKPATAPAASAAPQLAGVDAASAKAQAKQIQLSADLVARVEKYARNADAVAKGGPDNSVCSLVDEAISLGADIHASAPSASTEELERVLPGIAAARGGASFEGLARLASAKHASSTALLSGAGGLLDPKRPAFLVMKKDESGCTDYARAQASIEKIAKGWKSAPACLKERMKAPLAVALADDSLSTCYCADADTAASTTRHYAAQLSTLKDFDGPGKAKALLAEVEDSSAHFTCNN